MAAAHLFELDSDIEWAAITVPLQQDVFLRFTHVGVEAEYIRFAHRTRNATLVFIPFAASAVFVAFGIVNHAWAFAAPTVVALVTGLLALFTVYLWPWGDSIPGRRLQARLRDLIGPGVLLTNAVRTAIGYHDHVTCESKPGGFEYSVRDYCMHFILPATVLPPIIVLQPRFWQLVLGCVVTFLAQVVGSVVYDVQDTMEKVSIAALMLCTCPGLCWISYVTESAMREHFETLVVAQRGREAIATAVSRTAKVLEAAVPEIAVARVRRARSLDEALVQDTSLHATIGIVDIVDFARWSTGLLPVAVVHVLHRLFTLYDKGCPVFGVTKAATYADSYTVVAGLGVPHSKPSPAVASAVPVSALVTHPDGGTRASASGQTADSLPGVAEAAALSLQDCANRVVTAARWQVDSARAVSAMLSPAHPFVVRGAVASGPLAGGIVGHTSSLRYIVAGQAADECWALLAASSAGLCVCVKTWDVLNPTAESKSGSVTAQHNGSRRGTAPKLFTPENASATANVGSSLVSGSQHDPADPSTEQAAITVPFHSGIGSVRLRMEGHQGESMLPTTWANSAATTLTVDDGIFEFSHLHAVFVNEETENDFYENGEEATFRFCAASMAGPTLFFIAALVITALEKWAPAVGRDGTEDITVLHVAGLAAVVILAIVRLALLIVARTRVHKLADTALVFVIIWGYTFSMLMTGNSLMGNRLIYLSTLISNTRDLIRPGQCWVVNSWLYLGVGFVPVVAVSIASLRSVSPELLLVVAVGLLFIFQAYSNATESRAFYATQRVAANVTKDADARNEVLSGILHAVLPPHVARVYLREQELRDLEHDHSDAVQSDPLPLFKDGNPPPRKRTRRPYHQTWDDLTFVHIRFHPPARHPPRPDTDQGSAGGDQAFHVASQRLASVARALESVGGRLEVLESKADTVLVAGPFQPDPGMDTPRHAIEFVRSLAKSQPFPFTVILNAGSAFGALLGSDLLTYRLFGPGVRESEALMAAAPDVWGLTAVYASSSFRRQCEAAELHRQREEKKHAAASHFLADDASSPGMAASQHPKEGAAAAAAPTASQWLGQRVFQQSVLAGAAAAMMPMQAAAAVVSRDFGPTLRWRSRGAGVSFVSVVRLDVASAGPDVPLTTSSHPACVPEAKPGFSNRPARSPSTTASVSMAGVRSDAACPALSQCTWLNDESFAPESHVPPSVALPSAQAPAIHIAATSHTPAFAAGGGAALDVTTVSLAAVSAVNDDDWAAVAPTVRNPLLPPELTLAVAPLDGGASGHQWFGSASVVPNPASSPMVLPMGSFALPHA